MRQLLSEEICKEIFNSDNIFIFLSIDESFGDDILRRSDKTPNSNGLKLLGIKEYSRQIFEILSSGKIKFLYILNEDISILNDSASFLKNIQSSVQQITYINEYSSNANVIFPVSSYAEINGTFVNFQNRIQRVRPAVTALEQERLIGEFQLSRWINGSS
ncbi:MAG: molybdopterin-dependent oxidoreductase [Ignavibacteria bacterium]|nr:molybdopterin-dependent oxidoreductase [Ignavibacteria bacterium]